VLKYIYIQEPNIHYFLFTLLNFNQFRQLYKINKNYSSYQLCIKSIVIIIIIIIIIIMKEQFLLPSSLVLSV